jgi:hypothetical protein
VIATRSQLDRDEIDRRPEIVKGRVAQTRPFVLRAIVWRVINP